MSNTFNVKHNSNSKKYSKPIFKIEQECILWSLSSRNSENNGTVKAHMEKSWIPPTFAKLLSTRNKCASIMGQYEIHKYA